MNKKMLSAIVVATAITAGYCVHNEYGKTKLSGALLANVEALADAESSGNGNEYPKYINKTEKNSYKSFKTEVRTDTSGVEISIQYSRTCTTNNTYCKHTGKKGDICYGSLNGLVTDCGDWSRE